MEFLNWKKSKEVSTISFEVRILMKKPKIFMECFYVSFRKKIFIFGFNNFIWEENKNNNGNTAIPSKSHWRIGLELIFMNGADFTIWTTPCLSICHNTAQKSKDWLHSLMSLKELLYTAVTTTWIQISNQNWNGFFSNASYQIMI